MRSLHSHAVAEERYDPTKNGGLRKAVLDARGALIPENYIARVLQLAKQGWTHIEIDEYDTDWTSKAYYTAMRAEQQQPQCALPERVWQRCGDKRPVDLYCRTELEKAKKENRNRKPKKTLAARDLWDRGNSYAAWRAS